MGIDPRFPRSERELIRDFDLAGKLRDIRQSATLRERLAPKWWEALIGLLQFAAALGLIAAVLQHPYLREDALLRIIVFFFVLLVLSLLLGFEFVIFRLHHLRRANEIAIRRLEALERDVAALRPDDDAGEGNSAPPQG